MRCMRMLVVVAMAFVFAAPAKAQCLGDDQLFLPGGCCVPVFPVVPSFPGAAVASDGACFFNCAVQSTWPNTILLAPPFQLLSDLWISNITVVSTLTPSTTGILVMKYARTWAEPTASGVIRQVWRFLVNCDLNLIPPASSPSPCPVPSCVATGLPVHFIGSVDYAFDCGTNVWQTAINLTHHTGAYMHGGSSQRPLSAPFDHPDYAYAFVGPAPFIFGPTTPLAGPVVGETQRSTNIDLLTSPLVWTTFNEITAGNGFLIPAGTNCPGANTSFPIFPGWTDYQLSFDYTCFTGIPPWLFTPIPLPPLLPTGISAMSLGVYNSPLGAFPGPREVETWIGLAIAQDPCPISSFSLPFHIVNGVSTHGAGIAFPFNVTIPTDKFIDLQNMMIPNGSAPHGVMIGIGSVFASTQHWSLNVP